MADRLSIYNGALLECKERKLATLSDNTESRRLLDTVWDGGAVDFALQQGQWSFAARTVEMAPDAGAEYTFGYQNAFEIPTDLVRTLGLTQDGHGNVPLLAYVTEGGYIFADIEPIYLRYVSNDPAYGGDISKWPPDFIYAVEVYIASRIVGKLTGDDNAAESKLKKALALFNRAASVNAMEGPTKFPPAGSWARARVGGNHLDRGKRGTLIG